MDAGGSGASRGASARSTRHAVLLAARALGANDAAVRDARRECEAAAEELSWTLDALAEQRLTGKLLLNATRTAEVLTRVWAAVAAAKQAHARHVSTPPTESHGAPALWDACAGGHLRAGAHARWQTPDGAARASPAAVESAEESKRQALLLTTAFLGVSDAAVREARAERDTVLEELRWALDRIYGPNGASDGANDLLARAMLDGKEHALRHALSRNASVTRTIGAGLSPLQLAVGHGHASCLRLLLEAGAHSDAPNKYGWSPVHVTAIHGHADCLRLLLEAGTDADSESAGGFSPLYLAALHGNADCVRALLSAGAHKDKAPASGLAPAHVAARQGNIDCLRLLLEAGADACTRDACGHTALDVAERNNRREAAALLRRHAALRDSRAAQESKRARHS